MTFLIYSMWLLIEILYSVDDSKVLVKVYLNKEYFEFKITIVIIFKKPPTVQKLL